MKIKSLLWIQFGLLLCNINFISQINNGIPSLALSLIFAKWFFDFKKINPFKPIYMNIAAVFSLIIVYVMHKGNLNQDASISFLILLSSLKNLEIKVERDEKFLKLLLLLNVASQFVYSFDTLPLFFGLISIICFLKAMNPEFNYRSIMVSLIVMTSCLFIFFPRLSNPFKIRGYTSSSYSSGFTDDMAPGSIENIIKNTSIAFYANVNSRQMKNDLYWKGQVLRESFGLTWKRKSIIVKKNASITKDVNPDYEVTLEPHNSHWLYSLQKTESISLQEFNSSLREGEYFESLESIRKRLIYKGWFGKSEDLFTDQDLQLPKKLPENFLKITNDLGVSRNTPGLVKNIEEFILKNEFKYSLNPGKKSKDLESFINSKIGFCEHYAALSSLLLRFYKVPSRVVIGYQGGKYVQNAQVWKYTNADAHAWSEYWFEGEWRIFDLTNVLAPERLTLGGELFSFIPEEMFGSQGAFEFAQKRSQNWFESLKNSVDALQYQLTYFFLTYDFSVQAEFISKLFSSFGILIIIFLLIVGFVHFLIKIRNESQNPLLSQLIKLSKRLKAERGHSMTLTEWKMLIRSKAINFIDPIDLDFVFVELERSIYSPISVLKQDSYREALKLVKKIGLKKDELF